MTLVSSLGLCSSSATEEPIQLLAPKAFIASAQADSTAVILDVRRPSEFAEGHLKGAILLDWLSNVHTISIVGVASEAMLLLHSCSHVASRSSR